MSRTTRSDHRRPLTGAARQRTAVGTLLGSALVAALIGASLSGCSSTSTAPTTTQAKSTTTTLSTDPPVGAVVKGLQRLKTGQCFLPVKDPDADERAVWAVACDDPHLYELFARIRYTGPGAKSGGYPGTVTVQNWAEQACFDRFEEFVGIPWTRSSLEIQTWWPSVTSWGFPDRTVLCAVTPDDGSFTTGSQQGATS